ncbi:YciI family protein (plasmid) [Leisingera sp. M527]|uniref:YciI family protein n=1 Tax=Leisingera sp. M527 TaxID=2867014 RepID=UPI0021A335D0|nr:YciI family protein [Leisingera sp. M527]UWQ35442.1 YciI family protein [Leisingera sp. M527]
MTLDSVPIVDIIEKSQGMLALQLFIIRSRPSGPLQDVLDNVPDHLEYQVDIEKRGILFAAGPVWEAGSSEWRGEGVVVVRAADIAEAEQIAGLDPMHARGARAFSVESWLVNEGGFSVRVSFSDSRAIFQ